MNVKQQRQTQQELKFLEEAAEWLDRLESGDPSLNEEYSAWLRESPKHVEAMLKVSALNASLLGLDPDKALKIERGPVEVSDENVVPLCSDTSNHVRGAAQTRRIEAGSRATMPVNPRRWFTTLLACGAVLGVVASAFWAYRAYEASLWQRFETAAAEESTYTLADGSSLQLAPASRVDVRYRDSERELKLQGGEALFKVHHDTTRPFRVYANGMMVEAVGTQFTVRQRMSGATVSVLEGRVRVEARPADAGRTAVGSTAEASRSSTRTSNDVAEPLLLSAGEQARMNSVGRLEGRGKGDLSRLSAWPEHRLVFVDEPLQKIVSDFNRYNPSLQIRVDESDGSIGQYFTGSFDAQDPESWLAVLERNPALQIEQRDGEVVIRRR